MPFSQEKIDAYKKLDEAVDAIRQAYGYNDDILTGWLLLTSSVRIDDEPDSEDDDLDLRSSIGWYTKRGQDPTLSYGILNEAIRHYDQAQKQFGEE